MRSEYLKLLQDTFLLSLEEAMAKYSWQTALGLNLVRMGELINPTNDQLLAIWPHLTKEEIQAILELVQTEKFLKVAGPPLILKKGYQTYLVSLQSDDSILIQHGNASSLDAKPSNSGNPPMLLHAEKAVAFANEHWSEALIEKTWVEIMQFALFLPEQGFFKGHELKSVHYACINTTFNKILNTKRSLAGATRLVDDAIVMIEQNPLLMIELLGGKSFSSIYVCANCGGALSLHDCENCGLKFRDDGRAAYGISLTDKLRSHAEKYGFPFKTKPRKDKKEPAPIIKHSWWDRITKYIMYGMT